MNLYGEEALLMRAFSDAEVVGEHREISPQCAL